MKIPILLNLTREQLAIIHRLAVEGAAKECHEAAELMDRGWVHRNDDGVLRLTSDGAEGAKMAGIAHDGAAAADGEPTSSAPT
jgi:hypothetical protein